MNMYVDSFDDDELEIVLDESEGLEVLLNSGAITWSEIAGDITKNKAVVDFLNSLPMLPDIPVEEVEHILKANAGEATWQIDNKATQEELLNGLNEVNQLITDGLATKQDVGDYALRSELEEASQTLQDSIDTKQDVGDYATNTQLNDGLATKQDVGDYALRSELEEASQTLQDSIDTKQDAGNYALVEDIPDLTDYVKNTDYAGIDKAGLIMASSAFGTSAGSSGYLTSQEYTLSTYGSKLQAKGFVSKGTLENIKDDYVKRGLTENTIELSADEKANAKQWLGYAEPADIISAIAAIPQFKLTIVPELPETGEKMTLYFVPKAGADTDVHDEYIWIEENSKYEYVGTTAVDLTDYVKNTDYATADKGGVIKQSTTYGFSVNASTGIPFASTKGLAGYQSSDGNMFIGKNTLENIKNNYVKEAVTANDIQLTDEEKTSARTWLGAIGNADYAQGAVGGVVKTSAYYGVGTNAQGFLLASQKSLSDYDKGDNAMFVAKGTLTNVLTQYAKTVLITEDDYNALETKDSNTLYLIEE